ncbi:hypothetical protein ACFYTQ_19870 [Nocardia sp. NPDC004068]|uniref:DUF7373 family lipoprotein n=1 Tax=Nocardia sp. NPDC004068 TaxID=3364303 RepID=UPI003689204E
MSLSRRIAATAVAAAVSLLISACGSVSGHPAAGEIDVRKLDVGSYSTDPNDMRYNYYPGLSSGKHLAIMRLADKVVNGLDIDPKLKYSAAGRLAELSDAPSFFQDHFSAAATQYGLLYGFSVSSSDHDEVDFAKAGDTYASVLVMQYPDEASAAAAAQAFETIDFDVAKDQNQSVQLAKYPAARSHWRPGIRTLGSWLARGSYVVNIFARTPRTELPDLTALTEHIYDVQLPPLDSLKPLTKREILHLPMDPDDILRRIFTKNELSTYSPFVPITMSVTSHAFLAFAGGDTSATKSDLEASGIDVAGVVDKSVVLRARDAAAAQDYVAKKRQKTARPVDGPADVPDVLCAEDPDSEKNTTFNDNRFRCMVHYGRYIARVNSSQLADAQQRAAAQYAQLANSW